MSGVSVHPEPREPFASAHWRQMVFAAVGPGSSWPPSTIVGSVYPERYSTFRFGCRRTNRSKSLGPLDPGMTTSVSSRSNVSGAVRTAPRPAAAFAASSTRSRRSSRILRVSSAHRVFVLDDQDRFRARAGRVVAATAAAGDLGVSVGARQVDLERRALAELAVDPDVAAALLDDAVDGREPEPGALAAVLRREERLEEPAAASLRVMPIAGVADREHHVRARGASCTSLHERLVELDVRRLDRQACRRRHRVPGVDDEVHEDLLELPGIGVDAAEVGRADSATSSMSSPISRRSIGCIPVTSAFRSSTVGLQHLLAAEGEQLPRQRRRRARRP